MTGRRTSATAWAVALALGLGSSGLVQAQTAPAAQRRKPAPAPALVPDALAIAPSAGGVPDVVSITRYPTGIAPLEATPPPTLRSAVRSRYAVAPTIASRRGGQCRSQCAETRLSCLSPQSENAQCDPAWTRCLSTCDGLDYARGP